MRRTLISSAALVAAVAGSLVLAPAASASEGPKGDNGTVKIHDAKTGEEIKANEPKVCTFYLDAFHFDAQQKATWRIEAWSNNDQEKGTEVKDGSLTLDADGHGRTEDLNLADGQYKLFWNFDGENGKAKHKVFKVDCPAGTPGTETPGTETPGTETPGTETPGTETPGTETPAPSESTPGGTESPAPSETPGGTESAAPSATPSVTTPAGETAGTGGTDSKGEGDLAETGSSAPVGVLAAVAVALAGAGAFLVTRRRKAQQG
ncbi:LPXTG cell wall anchor domain-containing protein [Streptomyces sp. WAC01280]|uniref:LPXTG cell wall anchor domain-containing protein n=1 Tax=Streptomyces sp. WAC01280 TaxID=2487424 RepID=UPI000F797A99|nr:LPXTG cell wall anchor domain-containing protein [Streptomyces sp. WAC01280]RSS51459.1 LPXTG cell wall anchor domain-containing protein [Streptomyces sp. WAC01280]